MRMERSKKKLNQQQQRQPYHLHPFQKLLEGPGANGGETRFHGGGLFARATMTGEQMEQLRKQIAAYSAICDQLVGLYRSVVVTEASRPDFPVPGGGSLLWNPPCCGKPMMAAATTTTMTVATAVPCHDNDQTGDLSRVPRKQRWNPTAEQLRILERMFEKGDETPSRGKVKAVAAELEKQGQIGHSNVYNWFQNRRARLRKKQQQQHQATDEAPDPNDVVGSGAKAGAETKTVRAESSKVKKLKVSEDIDAGSLSPVHPTEEAGPLRASDGGGSGSSSSGGSFGSDTGMHEGELPSRLDYMEVHYTLLD